MARKPPAKKTPAKRKAPTKRKAPAKAKAKAKAKTAPKKKAPTKKEPAQKATRGRGRPTDFKKAYVEQAYKLALLGATDKDMADFFEVTEQTINNWKIAHPEFFESLKAGKSEADAQVVRSLFQRACGYSHPEDKIFQHEGNPVVVPTTKHYPPDATSAIFWLKNRDPANWRDKVEHEVELPEGVTMNFYFGGKNAG